MRLRVLVMCCAALALALFCGTAGTAIDGVSGQVELLSLPPASVQPGALSSVTVMRGFDERQQVTLSSPLSVNISEPGTYKLEADGTPAVIPAGRVVNSQFVHIDTSTTSTTTLTGTVHLDSDILGIITDNAASQLLDASDFLGSPSTLYPAPMLFGRGFELTTNEQDQIVVHADRRTVDITSSTDIAGIDQLRIVTALGRASTTISTVAGGGVTLGSGTKLSDTANLSGGSNPTGAITFTLKNPSNVVVYTDVVTVNGNGTYTTATGNNPGGYLPTVVGTYQWVATYSGDLGNSSATDNGQNESQTVSPNVNDQLTALYNAVKNTSPGKALGDKVKQIQAYVTANNKAAACTELNGFISLVNAQKGKKLTNAQVADFTAQANAIKTSLGC